MICDIWGGALEPHSCSLSSTGLFWSGGKSSKSMNRYCNYPVRMRAKLIWLCLNLCNPMDRSLPGSSVREILQARILEWVAISFSQGSSLPSNRTCVSSIAGRFFTVWATREIGMSVNQHCSRELSAVKGMWLLNSWNVTSVPEEMVFIFFLVLNDLNKCMWLVATILESTALELCILSYHQCV